MRRLRPRTSITIDEAVSILLGRSTGPIDFEPMDDSEEAEANCPVFDLWEALEDELDQDVAIAQASAYLCEINDEINKGEQSVLKVDRALSNAAYTYITRHSFNQWVKCREGAVGGQPGAAEPAGSPPVDAEDATKPRSRIKLREQEKAILEQISKLDTDPMALPKNQSGKSGIKAAVRAALQKSPLFKGATTFDKAWERLSKDGRIAHKT